MILFKIILIALFTLCVIFVIYDKIKSKCSKETELSMGVISTILYALTMICSVLLMITSLVDLVKFLMS